MSRSLVVILVEPEGALNVGSVARLCANFSVEQLRLVRPQCDPGGPEAQRMAVHGRNVLKTAQITETLAEALADCQRVVACSGRVEPEPTTTLSPTTALKWLWVGEGSIRRAVVFGRESRGMSNGELLLANHLLRIETGTRYASLNLSHAVAVVLHSWQERQRIRPTREALHPEGALARGAEAAKRNHLHGNHFPVHGVLEACLKDAEALLLEVGFLLPHTAKARMTKLRALLHRAEVTDREVALMRGMVRQLRWATRHPHV